MPRVEERHHRRRRGVRQRLARAAVAAGRVGGQIRQAAVCEEQDIAGLVLRIEKEYICVFYES